MTTEEIHKICKKHNITNYTINDDLSIDAYQNVNFYGFGFVELPLRFRNVTGWFDCSNNNLTSLEGAPSYVGTFFNCSHNYLTTLDGAPNYVDRVFDCYNNPLQSLNGIPSGIVKLYLFLPYDYTYDDYLSYCKFVSRDFKLQKIISKLQ